MPSELRKGGLKRLVIGQGIYQRSVVLSHSAVSERDSLGLRPAADRSDGTDWLISRY